jgi:hypothetical protein
MNGVSVKPWTSSKLRINASPAFGVLYNIGQVDVVLGRSVEAVTAFERYLAEGGAAVANERRREVQAEIERQRARIGTIAIRTIPPGAEARVDGKLVGQSPVVDVHVTVGRHTIEALLGGYATQIRELEVTGASQTDIELKLEPIIAPGQTPARSPAPTEATPKPPAGEPTPPPASESATQAAASAQPQAASSGKEWRILGYVVGAAGLATTATGAVIAGDSAGQAADAKNRMTAATTGAAWDAVKVDYDAAKNRNVAGWIGVGIGAAALAGGALLVVTAPHDPAAARIDFAPWIAAQAGGMTAGVPW